MNEYIKIPSIISVSGSNGSGKTYFIRYLLKSFNTQIHKILVFSNTAEFNGDYNFEGNTRQDANLREKVIIFSPIDYAEKIEKIMSIQKKNIQDGIRNNIFMIFDDVAGSVKDSKILKTLISQNRHFNITVVFSIQYINLTATYLREISYYDIIFELKTENSLRACYNNYFANDYDNYAQFKKNIKKILQRYHFFFADRIAGTKQIMVCP